MFDPGLFSFHLVRTSPLTTARACARPPKAVGLRFVECMVSMQLGYPIAHPRRYQPRTLAVCAWWDDADALDRFLSSAGLGEELKVGWHVRMAFYKRWGQLTELEQLPVRVEEHDESLPAVGLTVARLKLIESLRFIRWGKPVERLVRDHPGKTIALAAARPHHTLSTFSIWRSEKDMTDMVKGRRPDDVVENEAHIDAMGERSRRDFHHEFITMRFRPVSEHGTWNGTTFLPK